MVDERSSPLLSIQCKTMAMNAYPLLDVQASSETANFDSFSFDSILAYERSEDQHFTANISVSFFSISTPISMIFRRIVSALGNDRIRDEWWCTYWSNSLNSGSSTTVNG